MRPPSPTRCVPVRRSAMCAVPPGGRRAPEPRPRSAPASSARSSAASRAGAVTVSRSSVRFVVRTSSRSSSTRRSASERAARTASSRSACAATFLLGHPQGVAGARLGRRALERIARRALGLPDRGEGRLERCDSVQARRASATITSGSPSRSAMAKAWLPPGSPIVRRYVGDSVSRSNSTAAFR